MTVQPTEAGTFATNNGMGNFDMQLTGRGFRHDPSGHFNEFNPASAVFPRWFGEGWKNDELTGLITAGLQTADVAKRHDIYFQIQRILLSELVHIPFNRDYPVVQATTLFVAAVFVIANLSVDLLYGYLDPRLKHT